MPPLEPSRYPHDERIRRLARHLETHQASPLFVLLADGLLQRGEAAAAVAALRKGLVHHPQHPTARLLLARAYVLLRRYAEARVHLDALVSEMPACSGALALRERMAELELTHPPLPIDAGIPPEGMRSTTSGAAVPPRGEDIPSRNWSRNDTLIPGLDQAGSPEQITRNVPAWTPAIFDLHAIGAEELFAPPQPEGAADAVRMDADDIPWGLDTTFTSLAADTPASPDAELSADRALAADAVIESAAPPAMPGGMLSLELLASRLEGARIPILPDGAYEAAPDADTLRIDSVDVEARPVTETLASIYFQQGRLREALQAYRQLRIRIPARSVEFALRIAEIEGRLAGRL